MNRRSASMLWLLCGPGLGLAIALAWSTPRAAIDEHEVTYRPIAVQEDDYVSSSTCKPCHPSHYDSWHASYHRTMTQLATPASVRAPFDRIQIAGVQSRPIILTRRGAEHWAEFDDPEWTGEQIEAPRITRQVVMVTGSHQQQVYWYRTDRARVLGQLPAMYLLTESRWVPRQAAFLEPAGPAPSSEVGRWNAVCANCHTTHPKARLGIATDGSVVDPAAADTTAAEFGIACEACHGPGRSHVEANRNPLRRYRLHLAGARDATIVSPDRLDPMISSDVCGQCHSVWTSRDSRSARAANAAGQPFRPGDNLRDVQFVAQPRRNEYSSTSQAILADDPFFLQDSFWPDGMIRVSGREYNGLIESPCFADARDGRHRLTCRSCHTMHKSDTDTRPVKQWADTHQLSGSGESSRACLVCHSPLRDNLESHTRHAPGSAGSVCYNCHMPYTTYGLLRAQRSHQVSSPSVAETVEHGRPNACNLCHLDKSLKWTAEALSAWYEAPQPPLSRDERTIAASVLWLLKGDAGQRALAAWSMGWRPAQEASTTGWMPPFLSLLLNDPYPAVRLVAHRSLRSIDGFAEIAYDYVGSVEHRSATGLRVMEQWRRMAVSSTGHSEVPSVAENGVVQPVVLRLLRERNNARVRLRE